MKIDLSSLEKAIVSLSVAIERAQTQPGDDLICDGVIQRFEYTYELSWKMLKRVLEKMSANPAEIDGFSFKELLREGAEKGLIADIEPWLTYRHQRNITAHTYDEAKAQSVYHTAIQFLTDAKDLNQALGKHCDD